MNDLLSRSLDRQKYIQHFCEKHDVEIRRRCRYCDNIMTYVFQDKIESADFYESYSNPTCIECFAKQHSLDDKTYFSRDTIHSSNQHFIYIFDSEYLSNRYVYFLIGI